MLYIISWPSCNRNQVKFCFYLPIGPNKNCLIVLLFDCFKIRSQIKRSCCDFEWESKTKNVFFFSPSCFFPLFLLFFWNCWEGGSCKHCPPPSYYTPALVLMVFHQALLILITKFFEEYFSERMFNVSAKSLDVLPFFKNEAL